MSEPLDRRNARERYEIQKILWLGISAGVCWGTPLGAVYGFIVGLTAMESIVIGVVALLFGLIFGVVYGLVLGSLHGLILGLITSYFFFPLTNERTYRLWMAACTLAVNAGVGALCWREYRYLDSGVMIFFGWPLLITTIAALVGSQQAAEWYADERYRVEQATIRKQRSQPAQQTDVA